jgi:hypothetical protein
MLRFLSAEWIAALDRAAREARSPDGDDEALVIEQNVTGGPEGDVVYHLALGGPEPGARPGRAADPTVRLTVSFDVAKRISAGEESAQAAFMTGKLRVGGDIAALLRRRGRLADLDDLFAPVRTETAY